MLYLQLHAYFSFLYLPISLNSVGIGSGFVQAMIGGAVGPMVQCAIADASNRHISFSLVILCFVIVGACGLYAIKNQVET